MIIGKYLLVVFVLAVVVGCTQQDTQGVQTAQAQDTRNQGQQTAPTPVQEEQDTAIQSAQADASDEFLQKLANRPNLKWKADYDIKSSTANQTTRSQMTQYVQGTEKMRTDVSSQGFEARTYLMDETFTTCTKSEQVWTCFEIEVPKDMVQQTETKIQSDASRYTISEDGTETIAETSADCYKVTSKDEGAVLRYCFSSEGIPLYLKIDSEDGASEMVATSYSTDVKDSDFELPAGAKTQSYPTEGINQTTDRDASI